LIEKNHLFQRILFVQFVFESKNVFLQEIQLFLHRGQQCKFFFFQIKKKGICFQIPLFSV